MNTSKQKSVKRVLLTVLPHVTAIMAVMFMVFFVIDRVNEAMAFIDNDISKWLLMIFSVLTAVLSIFTIISRYRREGKTRAADRAQRGE